MKNSKDTTLKNKIKVGYILTPITFGGSEKVSLNFLKHIDRDRFEIYLVLLTRPWEPATYFEEQIKILGFEYCTVPVAQRPGSDPLRILRIIKKLYDIYRMREFDVVHTHGYFADICGLPLARLMGMNTVASCHGYIATDRKLIIYNRIDKLAIRSCHRVISVSEEIKQDLASQGIDADRIKVIYNAVENGYDASVQFNRRAQIRSKVLAEADVFVIGYVGRLSLEKGLRYLLDAAIHLKNKGLMFKLILVGEGPERSALEMIVRQSILENFVVFAGFQRNCEQWYPAFDAFVLPSLTEGTPLALLEAMAMGVPVVATSVGGVPNVIKDGKNGLLVESHDYKTIADRLEKLIRSPETGIQLAREASRTIAEHYNVAQWCHKIENEYEMLVIEKQKGVD